MIDKRYLGDGVYASFDGFHVVLTTGTDTIYFEDTVAWATIEYFNEAFGWKDKEAEDDQ